MLKLKTKFVFDENNKKNGVVLNFKDYEKLIDELEEYEDFLDIKNYKVPKKEEFIPFEQIEKDLERKFK
ncbi:hypothetical protein K9L05_03650 [Candidatus Babeliales bacterium]|nr:hypothetical protein [Candidatus Babeliales bacterium]MCF7899712.1 hypothetical protein [Candidatus Babeliales bacterium]